jgi:hypothetical protein
VWVPTEFHRGVFAQGGVDPAKLQLLGEPVDVDFFDPRRPGLKPYPVPKRSARTTVFLSVFKVRKHGGGAGAWGDRSWRSNGPAWWGVRVEWKA